MIVDFAEFNREISRIVELGGIQSLIEKIESLEEMELTVQMAIPLISDQGYRDAEDKAAYIIERYTLTPELLKGSINVPILGEVLTR